MYKALKQSLKKILGISAFYHDSAAALVVGGEVIAAAQEERFKREKHTSVFPQNAIKYCLDVGGFDIDDLDTIVFYDKPLLKFERLLETYYAFAPKGLRSFLKAVPVWLNEKLFLKKQIYDGFKQIGNYEKKKVKLLFPEHHLSHSASAFFASPYKKAAILTIDGVGEWCTASISLGEGNKITSLKEMNFPHSVGLLYSSFTYFLGFKVNSGEYKLMGLAPYGNPDAKETLEFIDTIKTQLIDIKQDGSIWLNQSFFNYATGLRMVKEKKWAELFGFKRRKETDKIDQNHCNLALAIQKVTEEIVVKMATEAKHLTGCKNICLAGGVALNCVANGKLLKSRIFDNIFIQPAAGDAGGALGAALAASAIYFNEPRNLSEDKDGLKGAYLGPEYSDKEIELMNRRKKAVYKRIDDFDDLCRTVAKEIAEGKVVGWFQGRLEFGPRALGNRSILGDARNPEMQKTINLKIKNRENFRPFAPSVLAEDVNNFFELETESPYMLFTVPISKELRTVLPKNYHEKDMLSKLNVVRSNIPTVTHLDFSARVQTVHKESNYKFWKLISAFKELTGTGLIINTSFNVRGEPIVCSPTDAYRCFMATDMDVLVIGNYLYIKTQQRDWENKSKWQSSFTKD